MASCNAYPAAAKGIEKRTSMNSRIAIARIRHLISVIAMGVVSVTVAAQDAPKPADPASPPVAPPPTPPAATQPTVPRTDLPAAKDILNKCIEAMGGEKAFDEMKSSVIKATFTNPMGEAKIEMYWMKPNKVFIKQAMQGMESTMGSDGTVSWMRTPMDTTILDPEQAKDLQDQSNMFRMVIRIRDDATELATVDQVKFNEFDCYKIRATDKNGQAQFALFDVKDHLIRGLETDEAGQGPATVKFSEWKEDAGIKYFTKVEIERMGMAMPLVFDEVKFNTLDETTFALPDDIKAMLKDKDDGAASKPATTNPAGPGGH